MNDSAAAPAASSFIASDSITWTLAACQVLGSKMYESVRPARTQQFLSFISGLAHLEFTCHLYTEMEPEAII
jgi:hypothetical protein